MPTIFGAYLHVDDVDAFYARAITEGVVDTLWPALAGQ